MHRKQLNGFSTRAHRRTRAASRRHDSGVLGPYFCQVSSITIFPEIGLSSVACSRLLAPHPTPSELITVPRQQNRARQRTSLSVSGIEGVNFKHRSDAKLVEPVAWLAWLSCNVGVFTIACTNIIVITPLVSEA